MKTLLLLLVLSGTALAQPESKADFASDGEVLQLLDHVDGLVTVFKGSLTDQQSEIKREYADDEKLISNLQQISAKLRKNPQAFNSAAGYLVVRFLFGIVQSEVTCSTEALMQANINLLAEGLEKSTPFMKLASSCSETTIFAKTVMDTADSLYTRSVIANDELKNKAIGTAMKCGEALKQSEAARKK